MANSSLAAASDRREQTRSRKFALASIGYVFLLIVFLLIAQFFRLQHLERHPLSTFLSFALVIAPYWFFGFEAAVPIRRFLSAPLLQIVAAALLVAPYFLLAIPAGTFHWSIGISLISIAVVSTVVLQHSRNAADLWDLVILTTVGLIVDMGLLSSGSLLGLKGTSLWPAGLGGFPKLILADIILYLYLVVKPIDHIGYDLSPILSDLKIGLREVLLYAPVVIPLGLLLGFLHLHAEIPHAFMVPAAWIFTFVFVALPEELFFRGLVQNLLERRLGRGTALVVASLLFGLSHFNKRGTFNWRYVLLAGIAGLFYGRAWRERRRLFSSSITHSTVDTIWSIWFR